MGSNMVLIAEVPADLTAAQLGQAAGVPCTSLTINGTTGTAIFAAELTEAQVLRVAVRAQTTTNQQTLLDRAANALQGNRDYLVVADTATNAQVRAQVKALTQQNTALIRLATNLLDGTD